MAWWAILVWACSRADPWAGAPALDGPATRTEWWSLELAGRPVGWEERRFGPGRDVVRRRTLVVASGGEVARLRSASRVRCDAAGCTFVLWSPDGGVRTGRGGFTLPEVWPVEPGPARILIESTGEIADTVVRTEEADRVLRWSTPAGEVVSHRLDRRPVQVATGRFVAKRVPNRPPDPDPPVDVARLLAVPAPAFPRARRAHVAVFDVGGAEVVVTRPTWPELPSPARERIRDLVEHVDRQVRDAWVPGRGGGAGRGDCTEHALALVAAVREAGFEARTAAGRVYAEGPDGPALVLHAWAEVRLGDRWVAADAVLRQFPADPTHLRLGGWVPEVVANDRPVALRSLR